MGASVPLLAQGQDSSGWESDIRYVAEQLPRLHPNFLNRGSREEFDRLVQDALGRVGAQSDGANVLELVRLFAFAGDGHTNLNALQAGSGVVRIPIALRWFDDGLWIVSIAETQARHLGKRVRAVQGIDVEDAHRRVLPWIAFENDNWARINSQVVLTLPEALVAAGIARAGEDVRYTLEDGSMVSMASGPFNVVTGPQLARPRNPLYTRNMNFNYWFEYLPESKCYYIQYNRCAETASLPMLNFTQELFEFYRVNEVRRAVFDLRWNTGGNSAVIAPLLRAFDEALNSGIRLPLACIVGRRTYSSGVLNAIDFKRRGAILVGEPTGGHPSWFGEVRTITLPNSKLVGNYSTRRFDIPGFPGPQVGVDVAVSFDSRHYFEDRDPLLDAALQYTERL